jgi:hypothetical protein
MEALVGVNARGGRGVELAARSSSKSKTALTPTEAGFEAEGCTMMVDAAAPDSKAMFLGGVALSTRNLDCERRASGVIAIRPS